MITNIGIDIDGVMAHLIAGIAPFVQAEYGITVANEDCVKWNYIADRLGGVGAMLRVMDEAWAEGDIPMMEEGLPGTLKRLSHKKFHKTIISARTYPSHPHVVYWLQDHGLEYDSLVFIGLSNNPLSKFDYPIDVLIDDRPSMVEEARGYPQKFLYLYDQPWNQDAVIDPVCNPNNVQRVSSLSEAVDRILVGVYA